MTAPSDTTPQNAGCKRVCRHAMPTHLPIDHIYDVVGRRLRVELAGREVITLFVVAHQAARGADDVTVVENYEGNMT